MNRNVLETDVPRGRFDVVTLVSSTQAEVGEHEAGLRACFGLLKPRGKLFYVGLELLDTGEQFEAYCGRTGREIVHRARYEQRNPPFHVFVAICGGDFA